MRKKVLFFLPSGVGGAERMTVTIGKMLPEKEYEVKFVLVDKQKRDIWRFIPEQYPVKFIKIINIWDFVTLRLIKLLRKERPYAVFSSMRYMNSRVLTAAHMVGNIKTIIRNDNTFDTLRWDKMLWCKMTYRFADIIIAQQDEMREEIRSRITSLRPETQVVSLQNPIDVDTIEKKCKAASPYTEAGRTNYVCVARVSRTKQQDVLIESFNKVRQKNDKAHLYLVGRYEENDGFYKSLVAQVDRLQLGESVHFVGFDENPYRWVKYADCFVLSSMIEGLPNSLIEALYIGCPVVATTCIPVIERIVDEGVNGYKVPVGAVDMIADRMMKAPKLGRVKLTYKSATKEDFIKLFE